ncbi:MAG: hypothetical protein IPK19_41965 [Chloroflexi bacterium]|nr:hypothetical protein [Chloroflexota bacterium]
MTVYTEESAARGAPSGRLLSPSDLRFDPGDRAALEARYDALGITGEARALAFDTIKLKEVLAANQPLLWGIPRSTASTVVCCRRAITPPSPRCCCRRDAAHARRTAARDLYDDSCGGPCIPDERWLRLTDTRYLLTDKVYDLVREGVFYDTALPMAGAAIYPNRTGFPASAVEVLYACTGDPCAAPEVTAGGLVLQAVLTDVPGRSLSDGALPLGRTSRSGRSPLPAKRTP